MILLSAKIIMKAVSNLKLSAHCMHSLKLCTSRGIEFGELFGQWPCNLINSKIITPLWDTEKLILILARSVGVT